MSPQMECHISSLKLAHSWEGEENPADALNLSDNRVSSGDSPHTVFVWLCVGWILMPQSCETFHPYSACVCVVRQINTHIPPKSIVVSVGTGGTRHRERLELASMTSGCKLRWANNAAGKGCSCSCCGKMHSISLCFGVLYLSWRHTVHAVQWLSITLPLR